MDIPLIRQNAIKRIWVFSDLQQSVPENARRCMIAGVDDFLSLKIPVDAVCYLGDTTEGTSLPHLREMAEMQVEALSRVDAPIYYAMGNHEFDFHRAKDPPGRVTIPMRDRVLRESQWHTSPRVSDQFFHVNLGGLTLAFLTDCAAEDGSWWTTHWRQISTIDESGITQFDIASFEDIRGSAVRSAIVEWYGGQSYGVFFRDHSARVWTKTYFQSSNPIGRTR